MKIPKKRGRPRLSPEEKARRKAEREAAKAAGRKHAPKKRVESKKFKNKEAEDTNSSSRTYLLTPAGKCPVELYGCDKEAIGIWMSQAKNCKKRGVQHTVQSLTFWLRTYFDYFSEEYRIAANNVKELADTFEIMDYEPILKSQYESERAKRNLKTIENYIETGEVE